MTAVHEHPAKFNEPVLRTLESMIRRHAPDAGRILDPFGGLGLIHNLRLGDGRRPLIVAGELELEWAAAAGELGPSVCADATRLPHPDDSLDVVATSCTYGNRFADHHMAKDPCKKCDGTGRTPPAGSRCRACKGDGRSVRHSYRQSLGRELSRNNSGRMHWGPAYRKLHLAAWREIARVLRTGTPGRDAKHPQVYGGLLVLNVSDHVRDWNRRHVTTWHLNTLICSGMVLVDAERVGTQRMGFGQNRDARIAGEMVLAFRKDPIG